MDNLCKGDELIAKRSDTHVFAFSFFVNFLLFIFKLYIGLSSNSICIYSDGINNLFDGLSSLVAFVCFFFILKSKDLSSSFRMHKAEHLLSFILSALLAGVGAVFLYNSAERLMYPAPVWFTESYFYILFATACVKLFMFFFLRLYAKKQHSDVIGVMSLDSLMDFFITAVTVVTLLASKNGSFSFDAVCGILISAIIIFSAVRMIKSSVGSLLGVPDRNTRKKVEDILLRFGFEKEAELEYSFAKEKSVYVKSGFEITDSRLSDLKEEIRKETGMNIYLLK